MLTHVQGEGGMRNWRLAFLILAAMAAPAAARPMLYVGNSTGSDVSVIDLNARKVAATITLGRTVHGVCAPSDGKHLYVTVESDHTLRVVDTASNRQTANIALPGTPNECAVTADGRYVLVPILGTVNVIAIVDTAAGKVVKTLPTRHPHNCAEPQGGSNSAIWCEELGEYGINRIDIRTLAITDRVPVAGEPRPFVVSADENTIYTALSGLHGVAIVDRTKKTMAEVAFPPMPYMECRIEPHNTPTHGMALTNDGRKLWVTSVPDAGVYVYDIASGRLSAKLPTGACPNWISMSKDGRYAAISNADDDTVSVFDPKTQKELYRLKVGTAPKRLLVVDVPD
jgi:YVTN family beta-propeller protein